MEMLWRIWFLLVVCTGHVWAQSLKHYDGMVGGRQIDLRLEWADDGNVKGEYSYMDGNRARYQVQGKNKIEGVLELNVYADRFLTARMFLNKRTRDSRISWVGTLKGNDGNVLAVDFSRASENQAPDLAAQASDTAQVNQPGNGEKVVKDPTNGALVWRPNSAPIRWTGDVNSSGFAEGKGTLEVFGRKGNRAAIFVGMMSGGHLVGNLTAKYPTSPDRAHYVGGYSNWAENGKGTMTYNDGRVVTGNWKNGDLVAITGNAPREDSNKKEPLPPAQEKIARNEPPDPDTAATELQQAYDRLKTSLQGEALQNLKVCQRAWIKYNETALKISSSVWDKPNEAWEGTDRFDALMAWQRTQELQFVTKSLSNPDPTNPLTDDLDDQVVLLSGQLRQINTEGPIKASDMAALKQYWDQSCQLANLTNSHNQPDDQKGSLSRRLLALETKNLNIVLGLWLSKPAEIASNTSQPDEATRQDEKAKTETAADTAAQETAAAADSDAREIQLSNAAPELNGNAADAAENEDAMAVARNPLPAQSTANAQLKQPGNTLSEGQRFLLLLSVAAFLIIALIGVVMGVNEKITVYNGNFDLGLTCLCAVCGIAAAVGYADDNTPFMALFIAAAAVILALSLRESMMANDSALRAILSVSAKFILLVSLILCGFLVIGGLRAGMDERKKGNKEKAAMQFALAALAALGARASYRLIKKLVKERVTRNIFQTRPVETDAPLELQPPS